MEEACPEKDCPNIDNLLPPDGVMVILEERFIPHGRLSLIETEIVDSVIFHEAEVTEGSGSKREGNLSCLSEKSSTC